MRVLPRARAGLVSAGLVLGMLVLPGVSSATPDSAGATPAAAAAHKDVVSLVTGASGRVTGMMIYSLAPGWTSERLADQLRAAGDKNVVVTDDPMAAVSAADRAAGFAPLADPHPNTGCTFGIATTNGCPPLYWSNNGYDDPKVRFNDHSSAGWPVSAAVTNWNQAPGIDSFYHYNSCPAAVGERCVDVWSANYGATGWHGRTNLAWFAGTTYRIQETGIYVELNDHYGTANNAGRRVACHELGHALGVNHATSSASCMWDPAASATVLTPGQDYMSLLAQTYAIYRQP